MKKSLLLLLILSSTALSKSETHTDNPCKDCMYIATHQPYKHSSEHKYNIENITGKSEIHRLCWDDTACYNNRTQSKIKIKLECEDIRVNPGTRATGNKQMVFEIKYDESMWCRIMSQTYLYAPDGQLEHHSFQGSWAKISLYGHGRDNPNDAPQDGDG